MGAAPDATDRSGVTVPVKSYYRAPYSPSQLSLAGRCLRRWAFAYRRGIRGPSGDAAEAGTRTHAVLEDHFRDGTKIDPELAWKKYPIGAMAATMAALVPDPTNGPYAIEGDFVYDYEGYQFTGRIDLQQNRLLHDWKTTSKAKYIKTPEALRTDMQALVYANRLVAEGGAPVELHWVTGVWSTMKATRVHLRLLPSEVADGVGEIVLPVVRSIHDIPADVDPLTLPPNEDDCGLFPPHGCEWQSQCAPTLRKAALPVNLLSKLKTEASLAITDAEKTPMLPPATAASAATVAPSRGRPIRTLYVDCFPVEQSYTAAFRLIATACQTVCDDLHIHNVRLLDFGKGGPSLAAQLVADIRTGPQIEALVLDTRTPEGREVSQALMAEAELVVRAL